MRRRRRPSNQVRVPLLAPPRFKLRGGVGQGGEKGMSSINDGAIAPEASLRGPWTPLGTHFLCRTRKRAVCLKSKCFFPHLDLLYPPSLDAQMGNKATKPNDDFAGVGITGGVSEVSLTPRDAPSTSHLQYDPRPPPVLPLLGPAQPLAPPPNTPPLRPPAITCL